MTNSPFTEPIDDLTAPIVTIDGGADAIDERHDAADLGYDRRACRQAVTVTVGGQTLNATVGAGGVWTVSAGALTLDPTTWWRRSPTRPRTPVPRPRS